MGKNTGKKVAAGCAAVAVLWGVHLSNGDDSKSRGSSSPSDAAAAYQVSTVRAANNGLVWTGVGATLGNDNTKVLEVPEDLINKPVRICWTMSSDTNSAETSSGSDDITMASAGRDLVADYQPLTGTGCVASFKLDRYFEVVPTGDWKFTITPVVAPVAPKTTSTPTTAERSTPSPTPTQSSESPHKKKKKQVRTSTAPEPTPEESCYPLTNGGNCYEPGEFCRHSDEGESGVAGNGEAIVCEDNNGLRWDPA